MDELKLREGEPIRLKRGMRIVPMISVDIPVEVEATAEDSATKQKTYMLKYVCPNGCGNGHGKLLTVRMSSVNSTPGVLCGGCMTPLISTETSSE